MEGLKHPNILEGGKNWPAHSFPPPPPPLHNAWIFQFIVKSFGLCYSLTVSEQI